MLMYRMLRCSVQRQLQAVLLCSPYVDTVPIGAWLVPRSTPRRAQKNYYLVVMRSGLNSCSSHICDASRVRVPCNVFAASVALDELVRLCLHVGISSDGTKVLWACLWVYRAAERSLLFLWVHRSAELTL